MTNLRMQLAAELRHVSPEHSGTVPAVKTPESSHRKSSPESHFETASSCFWNPGLTERSGARAWACIG